MTPSGQPCYPLVDLSCHLGRFLTSHVPDGLLRVAYFPVEPKWNVPLVRLLSARCLTSGKLDFRLPIAHICLNTPPNRLRPWTQDRYITFQLGGKLIPPTPKNYVRKNSKFNSVLVSRIRMPNQSPFSYCTVFPKEKLNF